MSHVPQELLGLPGIGKVTAQRLRDAGLRTPADLLRLLPVRYQDRRELTPIGSLRAGTFATVQGIVAACREKGPRWKRTLEVVIEDDGDCLTCLWFARARPRLESFVVGAKLKVAGTVRQTRGRLSMAHPTIATVGAAQKDEAFCRIVPIYPRIEGVGQRTLERAIAALLPFAKQLSMELLPGDLCAKRGLLPVHEALARAHCALMDGPDGPRALERAMESLGYDELLRCQIACVLLRHQRERRPSIPIDGICEALERIAATQRFEPTQAQRRVALEIETDLRKAHPMQRLLQGEVGSGKTVVATAALAAAVMAGHQGILMAPTSVLAEQHARTLSRFLSPLGIDVRSAMSSMPEAERRSVEREASLGKPLVLVGTHALAERTLRLPSAAVAVIDEQQRFGVSVRHRLLRKSDILHPHLLVVTATPIPRSLALSLHGDLELSRLDEPPPGRAKTSTMSIPREEMEWAMQAVETAIQQDRRAYWVCPSIDSDSQMPSVMQALERLSRRLGSEHLGVFTGRLTPAERSAAIDRFLSGRTRVLVSTTIVEVGVDVPDATVMVIDGAEHFGLSTLHQLRGRVGRGPFPSTCWLIHGSSTSPEARARLDLMARSTDGMTIALLDLEQRGPGDILGLRQSGAGGAIATAFLDPEKLQSAREDALEILSRSLGSGFEPLERILEDFESRRWKSEGGAGETL